jgi:OmpA-OmpF porin, OOP family
LEGAPEGFADAQSASLKALSYLSEGKAVHTDKTVAITGVATSGAIKALVIKNATATMPEGYALTTDITVVEPAVIEPVAAPAPVAPANCVADITALMANGQINFEVNKSVIKDTSTELLAKIASALTSCPDVKVEVGGHTDSDGSDAYNLRLSNDRANAVLKALVGAGVVRARITAKGYGETVPVAGNDTQENKAKNRRLEFRAVQ